MKWFNVAEIKTLIVKKVRQDKMSEYKTKVCIGKNVDKGYKIR